MGQRLGVRAVSDDGRRWLESLRALRRAREADGDAVVGVVASVGDVAARLVWRFEGGDPLVVRMPDWRAELQRGVPITLRPDAATRALLAARPVAGWKAP